LNWKKTVPVAILVLIVLVLRTVSFSPLQNRRIQLKATSSAREPSPMGQGQVIQPLVKGKVIPLLAENSEKFQTELKQFSNLNSIVLKGADQESEFHKLLEDPFLIQKSQQILADSNQQPFSEKNQELRKSAIDFMEQAIDWQDNPKRNQVLSHLKNLLEIRVSELEIPGEQKGSLGGDRIELFGILAEAEPSAAKKILEGASGTRDEKLYLYALDMYGLKEKVLGESI